MQEEFLKTTSAIYKILDTLPEGDPLKNKAKEKVLAIMENAAAVITDNGWLSLKKYLQDNQENVIHQILEDINALYNYLAIAKHQGWISSMNVLIIVKEYDAIKSKIQIAKKPKILESGLLLSGKEETRSPKVILKPAVKVSKSVKKEIPVQDVNQLSKKALQRHQKILGILSKRQKAQVADLIKELPNVTKRTIRRDLDDLLKRQKIVRSGEWNQVFYTISQKRG